jgi:hypothetical protein
MISANGTLISTLFWVPIPAAMVSRTYGRGRPLNAPVLWHLSIPIMLPDFRHSPSIGGAYMPLLKTPTELE